MRIILKVTAYILLVSVYGFTWLVAVLSRMPPRWQWKPTGRILVTGTFHNPNWYLSHITPLTRSGVKEVVLVVDEPQLPLEGVRVVCWPRWMSTVLGRTIARAIWMFITGVRYRPDLYMGYHLGPGACTSLVVGKLMGRPTCYQMTGGPVEIIGGGIYATDGIGAPLRKPSKIIEAMALAVVRQFTLVVVRGSRAKQFLAEYGITRSVAVITGSVQSHQSMPDGDRNMHLIFVGRLAAIKQVDQFIAVVDSVKNTMPDVRAGIVGDGPLRAQLQAQVARLGLNANVRFLGQKRDVGSLLAQSRIFVLTSKSEGLSIALAEAMSMGVVPIVADVGELSDLVEDGFNGYLIEPSNIAQYARRATSLLRDESVWSQYSERAIYASRQLCALDSVSERWRYHLQETVRRSPRCRVEKVVK